MKGMKMKQHFNITAPFLLVGFLALAIIAEHVEAEDSRKVQRTQRRRINIPKAFNYGHHSHIGYRDTHFLRDMTIWSGILAQKFENNKYNKFNSNYFDRLDGNQDGKVNINHIPVTLICNYWHDFRPKDGSGTPNEFIGANKKTYRSNEKFSLGMYLPGSEFTGSKYEIKLLGPNEELIHSEKGTVDKKKLPWVNLKLSNVVAKGGEGTYLALFYINGKPWNMREFELIRDKRINQDIPKINGNYKGPPINDKLTTVDFRYIGKNPLDSDRTFICRGWEDTNKNGRADVDDKYIGVGSKSIEDGLPVYFAIKSSKDSVGKKGIMQIVNSKGDTIAFCDKYTFKNNSDVHIHSLDTKKLHNDNIRAYFAAGNSRNLKNFRINK